jgi:hypothetical protein
MGKAVGLYTRQNAGGRAAVLASALQAFRGSGGGVDTSGNYREVALAADATAARSESWVLEVRGDGDWIRYYRTEVPPGSGSQARPAVAELEGPARSFIASSLATFVKLGPGEKLQTWKSAHAIRGGGSPQGERVEEVMASTLVFTREIGGVPVVGPGSKVAITMSGGAVIGFHIDWTPLAASGDSVTVNSKEAAAARIAAAKSGAPGQSEHSIECGFYDPGALNADKAAPLQPGCVARFISKSPQNLEAGIEHGVPVGTKVHRDRGWPETEALSR